MAEQTSKCILLMDEDAETLEKLQGALRREGFRVLVAADGDAGLRLAHQEHPDLIILDLFLAGVDGIQVCLRLREDETTRHIPILLHTALAIPERGPNGQFALASDQPVISVDAYMPKPTDLRRMLEIVWAMVEPDRPFTGQAGEVVLIIDNDSEQRSRVGKALSHYGYHIITAQDVNTGLRLTQATQPDLILVNDQLPGSRTIPTHARRTYQNALHWAFCSPCHRILPTKKPDSLRTASEKTGLRKPLSHHFINNGRTIGDRIALYLVYA